MRIRTTILSALAVSAVMTMAAGAHANGNGTPDGQPPAEEQACEDAGLFGSAFGLCVAFCEANDCDASEQGDDQACSVLRERYVRATGEVFFPCEGGEQQPD